MIPPRRAGCLLLLKLVVGGAAMEMKSVLGKGLGGSIDSSLEVGSRPLPQATENGTVLVRVLACALAPGDPRVLSGACDKYQAPPSFPYVPGGDVCGVVEDASRSEKFKEGDCVYAMFDEAPRNGLAEYAVIKDTLAAKKPVRASPLEAAALASSALTAWWASRQFVKTGDRVLVLGGTGGVGAHLVQLVKTVGHAHFVACTTSHPRQVASNEALSAAIDRVVDYTREENWWDEFTGDEPFDVVFDLVGGRDRWRRALGVLKKQGHYVTFCGDDPHPQIHSSWDVAKMMTRILSRVVWTRLRPPKYTYHIGLSTEDDALTKLAALVDDGNLTVVLDPATPVPFEIEPIRDAFKLQQSRHAFGKIVVQVSDDDDDSEGDDLASS